MKQFGWALVCFSLWTVLAVGCASQPFPQSTLTGQVVKVSIGESLTPDAVTAKQGDEVSWVNAGTTTVDLWFVQTLDGVISCQHNFASSGWGYMFGGSDRESLVVATLPPNGTASLCFSTRGTYIYRVHLKDVPEGRAKMGGSVTIE